MSKLARVATVIGLMIQVTIFFVPYYNVSTLFGVKQYTSLDLIRIMFASGNQVAGFFFSSVLIINVMFVTKCWSLDKNLEIYRKIFSMYIFLIFLSWILPKNSDITYNQVVKFFDILSSWGIVIAAAVASRQDVDIDKN